MFSILVRRHRTLLGFYTVIFIAAVVCCWFNSLVWPLKVAMTGLVFCAGLGVWLDRQKIARLSLTKHYCNALLASGEWVSVELTISYCDWFLVVLKLRCLDASSPHFRQKFWLWFYPGVATEKEQRQLRYFLANEFRPYSSS